MSDKIEKLLDHFKDWSVAELRLLISDKSEEKREQRAELKESTIPIFQGLNIEASKQWEGYIKQIIFARELDRFKDWTVVELLLIISEETEENREQRKELKRRAIPILRDLGIKSGEGKDCIKKIIEKRIYRAQWRDISDAAGWFIVNGSKTDIKDVEIISGTSLLFTMKTGYGPLRFKWIFKNIQQFPKIELVSPLLHPLLGTSTTISIDRLVKLSGSKIVAFYPLPIISALKKLFTRTVTGDKTEEFTLKRGDRWDIDSLVSAIIDGEYRNRDKKGLPIWSSMQQLSEIVHHPKLKSQLKEKIIRQGVEQKQLVSPTLPEPGSEQAAQQFATLCELSLALNTKAEEIDTPDFGETIGSYIDRNMKNLQKKVTKQNGPWHVISRILKTGEFETSLETLSKSQLNSYRAWMVYFIEDDNLLSELVRQLSACTAGHFTVFQMLVARESGKESLLEELRAEINTQKDVLVGEMAWEREGKPRAEVSIHSRSYITECVVHVAPSDDLKVKLIHSRDQYLGPITDETKAKVKREFIARWCDKIKQTLIPKMVREINALSTRNKGLKQQVQQQSKLPREKKQQLQKRGELVELTDYDLRYERFIFSNLPRDVDQYFDDLYINLKPVDFEKTVTVLLAIILEAPEMSEHMVD